MHYSIIEYLGDPLKLAIATVAIAILLRIARLLGNVIIYIYS